MDINQAYEILKEIVIGLEARGESVRQLPEIATSEMTLENSGIDLIAFSELVEDLSQRFKGRELQLKAYLIPENFYYLTIGKLLEIISSDLKSVIKNPIVVYIDDEVENIFIFKRKFNKLLNLVTFTNPIEALEFIRKSEDVRLVITDEVMPKMGGNDLCDRVHVTKPQLKFILITGNPNTDGDLLHRSLRKNRFYEFINKPVDFDKNGEEYLQLFNGALKLD